MIENPFFFFLVLNEKIKERLFSEFTESKHLEIPQSKKCGQKTFVYIKWNWMKKK